jgi:hypothetical protein
MYVRGNPLKYNDPSGHWLETGLDIISLGLTIQDINDNGLNWENGIGLVADVGSLVAPGVAGGGTIVRHADDAYAAAKTGVNAAWDWGRKALGYGDEAADAGGDLARQADTLPGNPCAINSFSADTLVMTAAGLKPIAELVEGDLVWAYNEATGEAGVYPIIDTISHVDPETVVLTLDKETLETTPEHPFYEVESESRWAVGGWQGRWTVASDLDVGDLVWKADGRAGTVRSIKVVPVQQRMYNLTVADAYTFFVGQGQWLVHNQGPCNAISAPTWRGGLRSRMEKLGAPPTGFVKPEAHHNLPWIFRDWFAGQGRGLDVNDSQFGRWVEGSPHGPHQNWTAAYEQAWRIFIRNNPNASRQDVLNYLSQLLASGSFPSQ